ncbi:hypothetical protein BBBOND_0111370 [Babesia bigemina]|uniref:C3H1-type domain-containing protein n=1 Tax=Babesia bigemina TaxID=5866 RepID=A0A061D7I1_BABBI|nr:hypothetical protein BBBOND_0111370 [Babesia bigemina]CDR94839.1 hypothetical protein BBBOND_0111370 [Babesia bigemina]|eukprot:XP_012767025.1 hypothetical protein BBBOND_0111370 [Babesia bigemina]
MVTAAMTLTGLVTQVEGHFKVLKEKAGGGARSPGLLQDWGNIKEGIKELVNREIVGGDQGLTAIVKGVEKFGKNFDGKMGEGGMEDKKFQGVLQDWLEDILESGPVKMYIEACGQYVTNNSGEFKSPYGVAGQSELMQKLTKGITNAIEAQIGTSEIEVAQNFINAAEGVKNSIEAYVTGVQAVCKAFAERLEIELTATELDGFLDKIVMAMEKDLVVKTSPTHNSDTKAYFKAAVNIILHQLVGVARGVGDEIQQFMSMSKLGNVESAITNASDVVNRLGGDTSSGSVGKNFNQSLWDVKEKIGELNPILKEDGGSLKSQINDITVEITTKAITEMSTKITDTLKLLTRTISDAAFFANKKLENLKNFKVGKTPNKGELQELQHSFNDLQRPVAVALDAAKKFLGSVDHSGTATIQALGRDVDSQVESAKKALITEAREQYVTSLQGLLVAFSTKAETELHPLPGLITKELDLGVKGFMNKIEKYFIGTDKGIKVIRDIKTTHSRPEKSPLSQAAERAYNASRRLCHYLKSQTDFISDFQKYEPLHNSLLTLLDGLKTSEHFNHQFRDNLDTVKNTLDQLAPRQFGTSSTVMLQALKGGIAALVDALDKTYVSSYSGRQWQEAELGHYAKICWTITPILYQELTTLKHGLEYENWNDHKIYHRADSNSSLHALFFRDNGYDVHRPPNAEHGELNHKRDFNGSNILKHLTNAHELFSQRSSPVIGIPQSTSGSDELGVTVAEESGLIRKLYDLLKTYFRVCHLTLVNKPKAPCSVYEILVWCNGLQFNPVYEKLKAQVQSEFMKDDKERPGTKTLQPFDAHPSDFEHTHIYEALYKVSSDSHAVLTAILGHGHKDGIYACEFSSNSLKLDYPSNMIQLLCTLFDLLKRLYHQLYFLLQQCKHNAQLSGWSDCHYGRYIGGSGWQCNTKQCPKQDCDQRHDQSGNQRGGQYPSCGVKSPLQSFLEDGLKGHLPHSVTARGSSLSCGTCGGTPGMPCRTPMGFADIGATASHTMIGQDICEVLYDFCGSAKSPLTRLCGYLNCLLPSAPKTLADMFSFYYHLTDRWGMSGNGHKREAFEDKVNAANFGRPYGELKVYHLFTPSHSALKKGHSDGSLGSLVCSSKYSVVCGPYLRPITHAIYETFSSKHADKYLSWIVYLTATFYDLLKQLYDECNSKCGSRGSNCHEKACIKECPTTSKHDPPRYHDRNCKSIVQCNYTLPTLAKYGFVLGDPERLNGSAGIEKKRTCRDFCYVFAEAFEKDSHLVQFFKAIDKFMFTIRAPFLWMNVALWSLSLFYLICVMVGRLDVLHIRSHLRTPSSHKITAQSLLAAAQVGRLAKISYLQP